MSKSEEIENVLQNILGSDRHIHISDNVCVPLPLGCGQPANEFTDALSEKEYRISGLCQECQDKFFV